MKLLIENWRKFVNEEDQPKGISYSAVMLDQQSIEKLKKAFNNNKPENFVYEAKDYSLPHHMTITMGALEKYNQNYPVGENITLEVTGYGISGDAMAISVKPPFDISEKIKQPHITFALPPGGKPFLSNKIENWTPIDNTFSVTGIVKEVPNK